MWCYDMTHVELYNISEDNQLMSKPNRTLEASACITSLEYHPDEPSILAAGLFNGTLNWITSLPFAFNSTQTTIIIIFYQKM